MPSKTTTWQQIAPDDEVWTIRIEREFAQDEFRKFLRYPEKWIHDKLKVEYPSVALYWKGDKVRDAAGNILSASPIPEYLREPLQLFFTHRHESRSKDYLV